MSPIPFMNVCRPIPKGHRGGRGSLMGARVGRRHKAVAQVHDGLFYF